MSQLNIHMTPAFERALKRYMRARGIKTKSEAVRAAVQEALQRSSQGPKVEWADLLGAATRLPQAPPEKWLKDDDLWGGNGR